MTMKDKPMYIPLTGDYISRMRDQVPGSPELQTAIKQFIRVVSFFAEPLKQISYPENPSELEWLVSCIADINHQCVKFGQTLTAAGLQHKLWEIKPKA